MNSTKVSLRKVSHPGTMTAKAPRTMTAQPQIPNPTGTRAILMSTRRALQTRATDVQTRRPTCPMMKNSLRNPELRWRAGDGGAVSCWKINLTIRCPEADCLRYRTQP